MAFQNAPLPYSDTVCGILTRYTSVVAQWVIWQTTEHYKIEEDNFWRTFLHAKPKGIFNGIILDLNEFDMIDWRKIFGEKSDIFCLQAPKNIVFIIYEFMEISWLLIIFCEKSIIHGLVFQTPTQPTTNLFHSNITVFKKHSF